MAWRFALGIAVAVGLVWFFTLPSLDPAEPVSRAVGGPIAMRPAASIETPAPATAAAPTDDSQSDPFAGVDVTDNSVLRHIAGIEEKGRTRRPAPPPAHAPTREPVKPGDSGATARPQPVPPASPALLPARDESAAATQPVPTPAPVQAAVAPPVETARIATTPQPAPEPTPIAEPIVARPASEAPAQNAPIAERPASSASAPSANATGADRVLVAALGKAAPAPAPSITPQLRIMNRTVPHFPVEAIRAGIQNGRVIARLTIEADGRVSAAQIISASPIGYFERESRRALATWRYEPPGQTTTAEIELAFTRE
jgi:TonB family protein